MKFTRICAVLTAVVLGLFIGCSQAEVSMPAPASTSHSINRIVAVVNDQIIMSSELDQALAQARAHAKAMRLQLPGKTTFRKLILSQLIARALQLQIAQNNQVNISAQQIDTALARMAKQRGMTVAQLFANVKKQGYTRTGFRQEVSKEIILNQLQRQVTAQTIKVSAAEVAALKQQILLRQKSTLEYNMLDLLVPLPDSPTKDQVASARTIAQKIGQELKQSANQTNFSGAQVVSSGWQNVSDVPQVFVNKLKAMQIGQASRPIRLGNGYHVIKLLGERGKAAKAPTNEQVRQIIFQQKFSKAVQKWVAKLRKQAYIKIM